MQLVRIVFLSYVHTSHHLFMMSLPWIMTFPFQMVEMVHLTTLLIIISLPPEEFRPGNLHCLPKGEEYIIILLCLITSKLNGGYILTLFRQNHLFILLYLIQCIGSCNSSQNHEDPASRTGDDKQRVPAPKDKSEASRSRDTHSCEF